MIVNNIFSRILFGILASCCLLACRGELPVLPSDEIEVGKDPLGGVHIKGMYLLNEGNMGSNKCTLDFYDSTTGKYHRNIYAERNPSVVKELEVVCCNQLFQFYRGDGCGNCTTFGANRCG